MKYALLFFLVIAGTVSAGQPRINVATMTLKDFAQQFVKKNEQEAFISYYQQLIAREKLKKNRAKAERRIAAVAHAGKTAFAVDHQALHAAVQKKGIEDKGREKLFLRYGAYQEFRKSRASAHNELFAKARTYVQEVSTKVVNWFGSWRRTKAV